MNDHLLDIFNEVEKFHWWWEGRRKLISWLLEDLEFEHVLDIGAGTGETLLFINKTYPDVVSVGIDSSTRSISLAKNNGVKNIKQANATKLPYKDKVFDVVLFLDVLEHIKDHQKAILEAKRVLKHGGVIIITSPAIQQLWSAHDTMQGHKRRYNTQSIKNLAKDTKLKTAKCGYFNFLLFAPIATIRLIGNFSFTNSISNYDNGINYSIAKIHYINHFLTKLFRFEIGTLRHINYPFGVSVYALLTKE